MSIDAFAAEQLEKKLLHRLDHLNAQLDYELRTLAERVANAREAVREGKLNDFHMIVNSGAITGYIAERNAILEMAPYFTKDKKK